jgi:hypothetical protein
MEDAVLPAPLGCVGPIRAPRVRWDGSQFLSLYVPVFSKTQIRKYNRIRTLYFLASAIFVLG